MPVAYAGCTSGAATEFQGEMGPGPCGLVHLALNGQLSRFGAAQSWRERYCTLPHLRRPHTQSSPASVRSAYNCPSSDCLLPTAALMATRARPVHFTLDPSPSPPRLAPSPAGPHANCAVRRGEKRLANQRSTAGLGTCHKYLRPSADASTCQRRRMPSGVPTPRRPSLRSARGPAGWLVAVGTPETERCRVRRPPRRPASGVDRGI